MNNIVLTYKVPCMHTKLISVQPMTFGVTLSKDEEHDLLKISFGSDSEKDDITLCIDIEPDKMWPLCNLDWWCGFNSYNLGWDILDIISESLAEHLSAHSEEYGDTPAEVNLNNFEYEWEKRINRLLAGIIRKEEYLKHDKEFQPEQKIVPEEINLEEQDSQDQGQDKDKAQKGKKGNKGNKDSARSEEDTQDAAEEQQEKEEAASEG